MVLWILVTCLFAITAAMERPLYDLEKANHYFEEFITTYQKKYENEEKKTRFEIFKENLIQINKLNTFNESIQGITEFTDLKSKEFAEQYNSCFSPNGTRFGFGQSSCKVITDNDIASGKAPASLDYRKNAVSAVKDQGRCGSCWAFASVGSLEGAYAIKHGRVLSLSAQQLNDCLRCSGHCNGGGLMTQAFAELSTLPGVETEADYPYRGIDQQCHFEKSKVAVKVTGCLNFQIRSEEKLKEALFQFGPIAIAIDSVPISSYRGGIVGAATCPPGRLGHAVLLVGYGTEHGKDYWLVKNSWGTNWGPEQGYVKFARGENVCGMMNEYAAVGVIA